LFAWTGGLILKRNYKLIRSKLVILVFWS